MNPKDSYRDSAAELSYSVSRTTCRDEAVRRTWGKRRGNTYMRYLFDAMLLHNFHCPADKCARYQCIDKRSTRDGEQQRQGLTYATLPPVLMHTQHRDIAPVRDISMHALLANDDTHWVRRLTRISLNTRRRRALSWINLTPSSREVRNLRGTPDAAYALARQPRFST